MDTMPIGHIDTSENPQGPAFDADLCDCSHDRGSHWNGTINCGYCGCQDFQFAGCARCVGTLTHAPDCIDGAGL